MKKKNKVQKKIGIVVPTIREDCIREFINRWKTGFLSNKSLEIKLFIVEDNPQKSFKISPPATLELYHFCWQDIEKTLGENSWIIPRRSDTVRSFGYYMAYKEGCNYIITLDDDCYPIPEKFKENPYYLIEGHLKRLETLTIKEEMWVNTINGPKVRGIPFENTACDQTYSNIIINHGLWVNVPDFDSITSFNLPKTEGFFEHLKDFVIPQNKFFPMCGMNLAWKREATLMMYFLLMGQDRNGNSFEYDRFGDIWCGIFAKKIADHLNLRIASGEPAIYHNRASNKFNNLIKEAKGIKINEILWEDVYKIKLRKNTIKQCYLELAEQLPCYSNYWEKLSKAMIVWAKLF